MYLTTKRVLFLVLITLCFLPETFAQRRGGSPRYSSVQQRSRSLGAPVSVTGKHIQRQGYGKSIISGAGTPGDIMLYSFDTENFIYQAENLTNGVYREGTFNAWHDPQMDVESNIYHLASEQGNFFGLELTDKFVATNFPAGTDEVSIYSGINAKVDNRESFYAFDGAYLVFHLNLENETEGMDWGFAMMEGQDYDNYEGLMLMRLYNTNDWLPDQIHFDEEIKILESEFYQDGSYEDPNAGTGITILGYYGVDPETPEKFNTFFLPLEDAQYAASDEDIAAMSRYYAGMGYADDLEGVMIIDLGEGNGYLQMIKISDTGFEVAPEDPEGEYMYIQSDIDFGSGGGFFDIYQDEGYMLDIHHYPQDGGLDQDGAPAGMESSEGLLLQRGHIPYVYFSDFDYWDEEPYEDDDGGERLYMIIYFDFIMHLTLDMADRSLLNFGVGAYSYD